MFPAPWLKRGRGGRVVTFFKKLMTTSLSSTLSLKKTALNQVRLAEMLGELNVKENTSQE